MLSLKSQKEIELLRKGGKILAGITKKISAEIHPGQTTGFLEDLACKLIKEAGGRPAFKGYSSSHDSLAFPTALCTSINDEVVHAPAYPSRILRTGDIIGLDIGMEYPFNSSSERGYFTDMAVTIPVGKVSAQARKLIKTTRESLDLAIRQMKPGNTLEDIARAIQTHVEKNGFSVVRELVGHGVGYSIHEDPQVLNFVPNGANLDKFILKPGLVLAIEPMVNAGDYNVDTAKDRFTIKTMDGQLSAHFEHSAAITKDGHLILTAL